MTVFEFVNILFSMLLSIAFAHMLTSVAGLIRAGRRVRYSALHALWMLNVFLLLIGEWLSLWDLRNIPSWSVAYLLLLTAVLVLQYLVCALVSPEVPAEGVIDLPAFHALQGQRYLAVFAMLGIFGVPLNTVTAQLYNVPAWGWQNLSAVPLTLACLVAVFVGHRIAQWAMAAAVLALLIYFLFALASTIRAA